MHKKKQKKTVIIKMATGGLMGQPPYIAKDDKEDDELEDWIVHHPRKEENEEEWLKEVKHEEGLGPEATGQEDDPTDSEEGEAPIRVRSKSKVTKEERENHELTHTPFRWWCRHCVRGRGRNKAHKSMVRRNELKEKKKLTPRVCIDYYF